MIQKIGRSDKHFSWAKKGADKNPRKNHQREDGGVEFCAISMNMSII